MQNADFSGFATRAGLECADGRTIMPDAFKHQDKVRVPLVWQHNHNDPENVLGHAILEARDGDVYAHAFFNDSPKGKIARVLVEHGDVDALSIFANKLVEKGKQVYHGIIRELSLVLSGANPGARIDQVFIRHSDGMGGFDIQLVEDAMIFVTDTQKLEIAHSDGADRTAQEVYDSMDADQQSLLHYMVAQAIEARDASMAQSGTEENQKTEEPEGDDQPEGDDSKADEKPAEGDLSHQEGPTVTKNVFDQAGDSGTKTDKTPTLSHDAMAGIFADARDNGSLRTAMKSYVSTAGLQHGIDNIGMLFPEARDITNTPEWNKRRTEWVAGVLNATKKVPYTRIRNRVADLTQDEARAKGYITGEYKKEQWFSVTQRTTGPKTVYKKQKMDRDDILDITDFDMVAWVRGEMRGQLDEEIATAILIGDGREVDDEDKIADPAGASSGDGIRSILNENELYASTFLIDVSSDYYNVVEGVLRARKHYRGSGSPTFYTTEDVLTELLLLRDGFDRRRFRTMDELALEMRVSNIVTVETMEREPDVLGIIVNLVDYGVGTDKGGEVNWFDDFDIDYNKYTYLIETRLSGALLKIKSAVVVKKTPGSGTPVTPTVPTFVASTGVVTIPTQTGVTYKNADTDATLTAGAQTALDPGETLRVKAVPSSGAYYFLNTVDDGPWTFTRPHA